MEYRFIDYVEVLGKEAYGKKCVSSLDWYFKIHFYDIPYMPTGFIIESVMQTGVLIVSSQQKIKNRLMMFQACDDVEIFNFVRPSDILETYVKLISYRRGIAKYEGICTANGYKISRIKFTLIVPSEFEAIRMIRNEKMKG